LQDRATPANFGVFRDTLLSRLRNLGQLQHSFDKKVKACEASFAERLKCVPCPDSPALALERLAR
jgi:hypothetical protein